MAHMARPLLAGLAFLAFCGAASAGTVERDYGGKVDGEKVDIVRVKAGPGESNTVTVSVRREGALTITTVRDKTAQLRIVKGCAPQRGGAVRCAGRNDLGLVEVILRDRDDAATVGSHPRDHRLYYVTKIDGGTGSDNLDVDDGGDEMLGGPGDDVLRGSPGYESMHGGDGDDTLLGRAHGDYLEGGPGDDVVRGGPGNDDLIGGTFDPGPQPAGRDRLFGEEGSDYLGDADIDSNKPTMGPDRLDGGPGEDTVDSYRRRTEAVRVDLRKAADAGEVGENDALTGFETVIGGYGDDVLIGDSGANWLDGRDGQDEVRGLAGNDLIFAWDADAVSGDDGDDDIRTVPEFAGSLTCGPGVDVVRLDVYLEKPADLPGPFIDSACERLTNGSSFSIDPVPSLSDGTMTFEVFKYRSDKLQLVLSTAVAPFTEIASAAIRGSSVDVSSTAEPMLRALVTPLGNAPFAWRFSNPGTVTR